MRTDKKLQLARRRHWCVRKKLSGTPQRPRMSVRFTGEHIYVQFVDDESGTTLAAASTLSKVLPGALEAAANVKGGKTLGKLAAEAALAKGIKSVVFDRGSARYHGKVKALADAAREAGLQF
jgi:large subunit ribosomal protein L18